jgi:ATP-dependent DNA helicase RecQ
VSLIAEQEEKLLAQGIEVIAFYSGVNQEKQVEQLIKFAQGEINPKFILVSPERLATDGFFEHCVKIRKNDIKLITIDEVHCVSQWGASFRPFYRNIPTFIRDVFGGIQPKLLALTATLNSKELSDIINEFWIEKSNIIKDQSLMRSEIELKIIKVNTESEKDDEEGKLWNYLKIHKNEKTLVYVYRKSGTRGVEDLSQNANKKHKLKSTYFHGDMTLNERNKIIAAFKNNEIDVVFATNAFGMGIDIPDVRVVIHFMIPESVEQYYQEIGRAARDKVSANAYLFYSDKNIDVKRKHFIDASFPTREKLVEVYKSLPRSNNVLQTLPYFENEDIQQCLHYYVDCGAVEIVAKGFSDIKSLTNIKNQKLLNIFESTKNKGLITSAKKTNIAVSDIIALVYNCLIRGEATSSKPLDKRLIINLKDDELSEAQLDSIMAKIDEKCKYKHDLLNHLISLLDKTNSSQELHQEIAQYLGIDKRVLEPIHSTLKGGKVRSKSEVIIANLLHQHNVKYKYELPLEHGSGKPIKPDFTIFLADGKKIYWEHLGLLGNEGYDANWLYKLDIYEKYFSGQLVTTYEGVTITDRAMDLINKFKSK